ncbi:MAG: acetolactate decarboxylase [Candidatus Omnitrophica bacterium]|nr:acetolactate decarboxylase [Candidatus Omnitrophota bacterium]
MKKNKFLFIAVAGLLVSLTGCLYAAKTKDRVCQFSTINALMKGLYDTDFNYGQIKKYGSFGIGTFNALDGEMVALDEKFYQVKADGKVYPVDDSMKSGFCVVKFFNADKEIESSGDIDYASIVERLEEKIPSKNIFYAVRIEGSFKHVKARSVPKQEKPYKGLAAAAKEQSVFEFKNIDGTLVGFRFPDYVSEINMAGWHFHFISKDKTRGGHVLDCVLTRGLISIDQSNGFYLKLPDNQDFLRADFKKLDEAALKKAEQ